LSKVQDREAVEPQLSPTRLERIVEAAQKIFLAHGFNGATTDMIQAEAAVSKSTLYRYFPTKESMFEAAMEGSARAFLANVGRRCEGVEEPEAFLTEFALEFLQTLLTPRALDIFRLMMMESQRFPRLGKHFYLTGPKSTADLVESWLARAQARGTLRVDNPALAAEHFIGMIRGDLHLRCLLGVTKPPSPAQLERYVASTVKGFLEGYGAG
jgi:TetR/AcrR family transcriptional repressor of mexJK operon